MATQGAGASLATVMKKVRIAQRHMIAMPDGFMAS